MSSPSIAIIGTGLAGLATGWWLRPQPADLYSSSDHPAASAVAAGLLHLFHGPHARMPVCAKPALASILEIAESLGGDLLQPRPIWRPARHTRQQQSFEKQARRYPGQLSWGCCELLGRRYEHTLQLQQSWHVHTPAYLQALKSALQAAGCRFFQNSLPSFDRYSTIIIAAGHQTPQLIKQLCKQEAPEMVPPQLDLLLTKGQIAHCLHCPPPPVSLVARAYISCDSCDPSQPLTDRAKQSSLPTSASTLSSTLVGATFERQFEQIEPQSCSERERLWQEALELWPSLNESTPLWRSGVRLSGPGHLPFFAYSPLSKGQLFAFSGLGSKGLLYHSWMAQQLCQLIAGDEPDPALHRFNQNRWQLYQLGRSGTQDPLLLN